MFCSSSVQRQQRRQVVLQGTCGVKLMDNQGMGLLMYPSHSKEKASSLHICAAADTTTPLRPVQQAEFAVTSQRAHSAPTVLCGDACVRAQSAASLNRRAEKSLCRQFRTSRVSGRGSSASHGVWLISKSRFRTSAAEQSAAPPVSHQQGVGAHGTEEGALRVAQGAGNGLRP